MFRSPVTYYLAPLESFEHSGDPELFSSLQMVVHEAGQVSILSSSKDAVLQSRTLRQGFDGELSRTAQGAQLISTDTLSPRLELGSMLAEGCELGKSHPSSVERGFESLTKVSN